MERVAFPQGKRYNSQAAYLKEKYGHRLQKVVIDAGFTCPNRDGKCGYGGCTFCNNAAFHPGYSTPDKSIPEQIDEGIEFHRVRYRNSGGYLAYFQSYSNTYAPIEKLKELYGQALSHPAIDGIVIGTRPDCVDEPVLDLLQELSREKIVMVEYGIESCYDKTLLRINRGHDFQTACRAVEQTRMRGVQQCAHFILGLPGESREQMLQMCSLINRLQCDSLKFHQLQIIKGTRMEQEFKACPLDFETFTLEGYIDFFADILERLRPEFRIERFAGEVPPRFVEQKPWGMVRNTELLRMLDRRLEERDSWQGKLLL